MNLRIRRIQGGLVCALGLAGTLGFQAPVLGQTATTVTITPTAAGVRLGTAFQFTARVTGNTNTTVAWTVALPAGDTGSPGTVNTGGLYTPPAALPSGNTAIVTVTSLAAPTASASATVTLLNPYPALSSTFPGSVTVGAFTLTANGSNFVNGAQLIFGGVALPTTFVSATRLTATGTAVQSQNNTRVAVAVTNPAPGPATSTDAVTVTVGSLDGPAKITATAAARFLDQAAFGPDAATIVHVQGTGLDGYITEQLSAPVSPYPDPVNIPVNLALVQARFFANAVHGQDQLGQRVALALSEIMVASGVEENTPAQLVPYLQVFQKNAFGNFRTLMNDITLNVAMGEYLDMRNNDKAAGTALANENYARELMQLFTIGLSVLNPDGTLKLDAAGNAIPTYDQATVQSFAKVYTGWTYPTKPGATLAKHNPAYYVGPMEAFDANHDTTAKTLLQYAAPAGVLTSLPAGQTAAKDLAQALDNIFYHPNLAPFISKQLIQHLVTSNPSPGYVNRVATVFYDNGSGVRGDLAMVVRAILLDPEARAGDNGTAFNLPIGNVPPGGTGDAANDPGTVAIGTHLHQAPRGGAKFSTVAGHLREPMFVIPAILRGLGAQVNDTNALNSLSTSLGQNVFSPPSVFSYFAPGYQIPADFSAGATLGGPEYQLQSPSAAVGRINVLNTMIYGSLGNGALIDLTALTNLGNSPPALMLAINNAFFYGLMPPNMRSDILSAVNAAATGTTAAAAKARAQAALYLALSSSYYNVEH